MSIPEANRFVELAGHFRMQTSIEIEATASKQALTTRSPQTLLRGPINQSASIMDMSTLLCGSFCEDQEQMNQQISACVQFIIKMT